jgi:hypothetical protein
VRTIGIRHLLDVSSKHDLHLTVRRIFEAITDGELQACGEGLPRAPRFTEDAANAWLTMVARRRGVRLQ